MGGVRPAVAGDLRHRCVPYGEELGEEGGGAGDAAVVAAELDEEEEEDARGGADRGDVDQVLDVAVPRRHVVGIDGRRRRRGMKKRWRRRRHGKGRRRRRVEWEI